MPSASLPFACRSRVLTPAWREERDQWIAQHPDLVERMRKSEDDFSNGVFFQAVTDAETAAGGW
jgi:hypothetical protein